MKKLFLLVLIAFMNLFYVASLQAQISLTQANFGYMPGQDFIVAQNGAGFYFFLSPQIGANQIWNFSSASSTVYDTIKTLSRAQAPFPALSPAANIVVYSTNYNYNDYSTYRFLEISSSKITRKGSKTPNFAHFVENIETPDVLRFPFSITSNFTDTASSQYLGANNATCTYKEIYTVEAVGYGQLITPIATYNQALQVRTTRESLSDNCRPQMYRGYSTDITYDWYVPGIHIPVYQVAEHTVSLGSIYSGYYLHSAKLGFNEEATSKINFQIFPNPATSELTLQYQNSEPVKITLHDLVGKQIAVLHSGKSSAEIQSVKIDVANYPKGIYLLRLETDGKAVTRKVILQ